MQTKRCILVPYNESHISDIMEMFREPDSNRFIQPLRISNEDFWLEKLETNVVKNKELLQFWSAYHLENGDFVGTLNLNKFADTDLNQLGVHLSRKYWNQGYGYELCKPLVDYAWKERKLNELHWVFESEHAVSGKLAEKLGFKPFADMTKDGCELMIYQIQRNNF